LSAAVLPYGVAGLAIFGIAISAVWFPIGWLLGRKYETVREGEILLATAPDPASA
jgi:hypothetical protein